MNNNKRNIQQRSLTSFFQPPQKKAATVDLSEAEEPQGEPSSLPLNTALSSQADHNSSSSSSSLVNENKENEPVEENEPLEPSASSVNATIDNDTPLHKIVYRCTTMNSKNIIHQLYQQSTNGTRLTENRDLSWTAPSWLPLRSAKATAMAFDASGVLLAVAVSHPRSAIRVYDWDMLEAADLHYRRRLVSSSSFEELTPVIDMTLSKSVSFLQWNPFQQDVLAVGVRNTGTVLLYDMGVVAEWDDRRGSMPCVEIKTGVPAPTEFLARFVNDGKHVIVAANQFVSCWETDNSSVTRRWTLDVRRKVTSLVPFKDTNLMAVGTINGILAVIDTQRLSKQPFSRESVPTVVKEFNTLLRGLDTPSPQHMGIRELCADPVGPPGWMQLKWVTSCGWHLSTDLNLNRMKMDQAHVHYRTVRMQCKKADGTLLPELPNAWSMPMNQKVLVGQSKEALFWENVPPVTQILPGHDSRTEGDDVCRYERSAIKRVLYWMNNHDQQLSRIPLSRSKGNPICFAIHPHLEWIIVGTDKDQLYLINSRARITF